MSTSSTARAQQPDPDDHDGAPGAAGQHLRPFAAWLREQEEGRLHTELGARLAEVVTAVRETGNKGALTLTLSIEPLKHAAEGTLIIGSDIKTKVPQFPRERSIFFEHDGSLHRSDPNQASIPGIELVTDDDTPIKEVHDR